MLNCPNCNGTELNKKCDGNLSQIVCYGCGLHGPFGSEADCETKWDNLPRNP